MKLRNLALVILLALSLSGCSWLSNNSDDDSRYYSKDRISDTDILSENDVRLIDVKIDSRDFSTLEISTCPLATQAGTGTCNAVTP